MNEAKGEPPLMREKRGRDDLHELQVSQPKRARLEDIVQPIGEFQYRVRLSRAEADPFFITRAKFKF